jgi:hypothetical protein
MALGDAEHALASGDHDAARRAFVDAGDAAVGYQLWRSAARSYRYALELDLCDGRIVGKLAGLSRLPSAPEWVVYASVLARDPGWPHFGCRGAQISIDDRGAYVECPNVGRVMRVTMPSDNHVDAIADARFAAIPLGMALLVLRRALWPNAREQAISPMRVQISLAGRDIWLDELGEWEDA